MHIFILAGVLASKRRETYGHSNMCKWNAYREFRHMNMDNYDTKGYGSNKNMKKVKGLTNDQGLKQYDSVTINHRICTREYQSCNGGFPNNTDDLHSRTREYILKP